jgi:hypothetical protein
MPLGRLRAKRSQDNVAYGTAKRLRPAPPASASPVWPTRTCNRGDCAIRVSRLPAKAQNLRVVAVPVSATQWSVCGQKCIAQAASAHSNVATPSLGGQRRSRRRMLPSCWLFERRGRSGQPSTFVKLAALSKWSKNRLRVPVASTIAMTVSRRGRVVADPSRVDRMNGRRAWLRLAGALGLGLAVDAQAQPRPKPARVALVFSYTPLAEMTGPEPTDPGVRAFIGGLRDQGHVDGRDVVLVLLCQ